MAQINHNISSPNDDLGDALRTAFGNQNTMNTELYATKVDKVDGFGLSENNLTDALVATIESLGTPYIPTLQEVLDNNHDLINGNNFQGTDSGKDQTGTNVNGFGNGAVQNQTGTNVNAFGNVAGAGNEFSNVNLFGHSATADANNQTVFSIEGTAMGRISYNDITADRKYNLPDKDGTFALLSDTSKSEYKTASFTAEKGTYYVVFWSGITVTDPATATNGDYFKIFTHYPITVGGVSIPAQSLIYRNYYGGNWQTIDLTNVTAINTLQTDINTRTKTVIKNTTAGSTITGTTAEVPTIALGTLIPANTFTANDIMRISSFLAEKTGVVGTLTMRIKVGTTATFGSATTIATYTTGATELWCIMLRNSITLRGGNLRFLSGSRPTDMTATSNAIGTLAFDPTIDNYLFTSLQLSNAGDSVFQSNLLVTN